MQHKIRSFFGNCFARGIIIVSYSGFLHFIRLIRRHRDYSFEVKGYHLVSYMPHFTTVVVCNFFIPVEITVSGRMSLFVFWRCVVWLIIVFEPHTTHCWGWELWVLQTIFPNVVCPLGWWAATKDQTNINFFHNMHAAWVYLSHLDSLICCMAELRLLTTNDVMKISLF